MLVFLVKPIFSNPIAPPPVISEFYLVNDSTWYLELYFPQWYYGQYPSIPDSTLDEYQITTSFGTSMFKSSINLFYDNIIVITQDSLLNKLKLNRTGDYILLERIDSPYNSHIDELRFGNNAGTYINSPIIGQSIVMHIEGCYGEYQSTKNCWVKETIPSIGYNQFQASSYLGTFSGKVVDLMQHPMSGIYLGRKQFYNWPTYYCIVDFQSFQTDSSGEYSSIIKSGRHWVEVFTLNALLTDTIINIEPDSVSNYGFIIDTLLSSISNNSIRQKYNITTYPNPTNGETTFLLNIPNNYYYSKILIKIYNNEGEIIKILPINISSSQEKNSLEWNFRNIDNYVISGIYNYVLEIDGKRVATNKLIITK